MKYLIHTGPGIGDVIQFLSMARAIKEQDSTSRVDFLMRADKKMCDIDMQIIQCQEYVDNIYWYNRKNISHSLKTILQIRKMKYDYGFVRIGNVVGKESSWIYKIMRWGKCRQIVGSGTDKVDIPVEIPERSHYLKRNEFMLKAIGVSGRKNAISLDKSKISKEWLGKYDIYSDERIVAFSVGTNPMLWKEQGKTIVYDVKSWNFQNWIKLAKLLAEKEVRVILLGGEKERQEMLNQGIVCPKDPRIIDLIGKTSINQSLSVLANSKLVIGAEGGMMHCASALGVKTLTLMGGSDYKMWNPGGSNSPTINLYLECAPCLFTSRGAHCSNHKCLDGIMAENVAEKAMKLL